jgi:thioredoxin reductase (NADPH)
MANGDTDNGATEMGSEDKPEAPPVPITVALGRVGAQAEEGDFAGAFPILDEAQITKLGRYGVEHSIPAGLVLFREGERGSDFVVVLAGSVEAVAHFGESGETTSTTFNPGQFVGVMNILSNEGAYVTATATVASRVLRVPLDQLRAVISDDITLSEIVIRAFLLRHSLLLRLGTGPKVIGSRYSQATRDILDLLARNRCAVTWIDVESDPRAESLLRNFGFTAADIPLVLVAGQPILRNPSLAEVAAVFGVTVDASHTDELCDLLVVGAGPAGLAASVYGGSEGLSTVVVEATAVGGQAGTSSRIENYLGFPAGLSGAELAARAALQAEKFSAAILVGSKARSLSSDGGVHSVELSDGRTLRARAIVVATGARYRRLPVERLAELEGSGVYYAATEVEAQKCAGAVVVVGGGNSAGQAAVFLSRRLDVHHVIRGGSLDATMSRYLIDQIERDPRITVHHRTQVKALLGGNVLDGVIVETADGVRRELPVSAVFSFIGAEPNTDWLSKCLQVDEDGFIVTGSDVTPSDGWTPLLLETSLPGIFAVGDVRHGSIKRVATAVGEGAMAVRLVHERLSSPALSRS